VKKIPLSSWRRARILYEPNAMPRECQLRPPAPKAQVALSARELPRTYRGGAAVGGGRSSQGV